MAKSKIITKGITAKRIQEIENYNYYLGGLVNINFRHKLYLNPIAVEVGLRTLKDLRKELDGYEISLEQISCDRIFENDIELTETEVFIRTICNYSYLDYKSDYLKIKEAKELDKDFPREQRELLARQLEEEIKVEYRKITTVGKINKTLRKACEAKTEELGRQLRDILSTLEIPSEEEINNSLYLIATSKIDEIKSRLEEKIKFLEEVMEEINVRN